MGRRRRSRAASRSSMVATHRFSSARLRRAGTNTMILSPSRYAETVRRRRLLRRTSTLGVRGTKCTLAENLPSPQWRKTVSAGQRLSSGLTAGVSTARPHRDPQRHAGLSPGRPQVVHRLRWPRSPGAPTVARRGSPPCRRATSTEGTGTGDRPPGGLPRRLHDRTNDPAASYPQPMWITGTEALAGPRRPCRALSSAPPGASRRASLVMDNAGRSAKMAR